MSLLDDVFQGYKEVVMQLHWQQHDYDRSYASLAWAKECRKGHCEKYRELMEIRGE